MVPDFAEVASLAAHTGGAPVDMVLPVVMRGTAIAGRSHTEQCRESESVGLLPTDNDRTTDYCRTGGYCSGCCWHGSSLVPDWVGRRDQGGIYD